MADTPVMRLRRLVGETDSATSSYSDAWLQEVLDRHAISDTDYNYNAAAAEVWGVKMADFANLVDTSEAGSSRKMSDLHKHAMAMHKHFDDLANGSSPLQRPATTRPIERV